MAVTMPNPDDNHQPLNQSDDQPFQEPAWVKPVKTASVIMGVLIVFCLALLGYGLSTNMGKLAEGDETPKTLTYPEGLRLINASGGGDGAVVLTFEGQNGQLTVVTTQPGQEKITSIIEINTGDDFSFSSE